MKTRNGWLIAILTLMALPATAAVTREYQVAGRVVESDSKRIVVRSDQGILEFARPAGTGAALRTGDQISVRYRLQAESVAVMRPGQAPGSRGSAPKGSVIDDDRVFYSASVEDEGKPQS